MRKQRWLMFGDCLERLKEVPDGSVDMVLCDPPYGTTQCKWDTVIPFDKMWKQVNRVMKDGGVVILFGQEPFSSILRASNIEAFRYDWYWEKDKGANFLFANKMPLKTVEITNVFYTKQPTYNPQKILNPKGVSKRHLSPNPSKITSNVKEVLGNSWKESEMDETQNYSGKNYEPDKLLPRQLIYFSVFDGNRAHPTQKPVPLLEYLIKTYTNKYETVLDFTMGSGSTGVACRNLKRKFIGIEKDKKYFRIAKERIKGTYGREKVEEVDYTKGIFEQ